MSDTTLFTEPAIIASGIAAVVTTLGIATVWRFHDWATRYDALLSAFAAGILLAASLVHVIPESLELTEDAPLYVLIGFLVLFFINKAAGHHHPGDENLPPRAVVAPFLGIAFHSFVDGIVYGTAFSVDFVMGLSAASGLIIHEFSEGLVLFVLVRSAGGSPRLSFLLAFLGAALTTPIGAIAGLSVIQGLGGESLGILLALSGGALLYVSTIHLTERFVQRPGLLPVSLFATGVIATFLMLGGHGGHNHHGHGSDHDGHGHDGHGHDEHDEHGAH